MLTTQARASLTKYVAGGQAMSCSVVVAHVSMAHFVLLDLFFVTAPPGAFFGPMQRTRPRLMGTHSSSGDDPLEFVGSARWAFRWP